MPSLLLYVIIGRHSEVQWRGRRFILDFPLEGRLNIKVRRHVLYTPILLSLEQVHVREAVQCMKWGKDLFLSFPLETLETCKVRKPVLYTAILLFTEGQI